MKILSIKPALLVFAIISILALTQCKKDETCLEFAQGPITSANSPSTGSVNENIPIEVFFSCYNGCGEFDSFEVNQIDFTVQIKVKARYEGCRCTDDVPIRKATYMFKPTEPGIYYMQFMQLNGNYLPDTLIIQ